MENEMTAEYANGYMAGVDAERKRVVDMITHELTSRPANAPPHLIHWTNYLLAIISVDGRSRKEILDELSDKLISDMLKDMEERKEE